MIVDQNSFCPDGTYESDTIYVLRADALGQPQAIDPTEELKVCTGQ